MGGQSGGWQRFPVGDAVGRERGSETGPGLAVPRVGTT
jgi:hypothetical protein